MVYILHNMLFGISFKGVSVCVYVGEGFRRSFATNIYVKQNRVAYTADCKVKDTLTIDY